MPEATNQPTIPAADGYVRAATAVAVTFHPPGGTVDGRLMGTMHARGQVHHYRVEGSDRVLYLVPPGWLDAASHAAIAATTVEPDPGYREVKLALIRDIEVLLDARDAARAGVTS